MSSVPLPRRLFAEFLGSAFLAATVIGSGIAAASLSPGNTGLQLLENAAATAAGLFTFILMFGPVSRAHFNPVVSLVHAAFGGLRPRSAPAYVPSHAGSRIGRPAPAPPPHLPPRPGRRLHRRRPPRHPVLPPPAPPLSPPPPPPPHPPLARGGGAPAHASGDLLAGAAPPRGAGPGRGRRLHR